MYRILFFALVVSVSLVQHLNGGELIPPLPLKNVPVPTSVGTLKPPPPLVSSLDQMSLNEFIKYASKTLKKNILVSGKLDGSIDYLSNEDFNKRDMLSLLRSVLQVNNYVLIDNGSFYSVVPADKIAKFPTMNGRGSVNKFGSKVFKINYINAFSILEAVKVHLSPSGSVFGVPDNKSLIVSDFPDNLKKISSIVREIDFKTVSKPSKVQSYKLVNSSADSVLKTISGLFSVDGNNTSLKLSVNKDLNYLIVSGDPELVDKISPIVSELDREQYQVYLQVRIIELNNDLSSKIGLKYGVDGGIVSASNFFTFSANLGGKSVAPVDSLVTEALSSSLGNVKQLLSIGAALDLLQSEGVSKTISDPSVLCLNNKDSKIVVGKSLSFLSGSTTGSAGTSNALNRADVGLNLSVRPLVASKDKLTLSVDAVMENILPTLDSNNQPMTSKQQIKTDSILHHGETIVLGGFVKSYDSKNDNSIPFLSDLPLIGSIFKHDGTVNQSDTLLLVITPYIIDDSRTLSSLQNDLGLFGQIQKAYNQTLNFR
jgi:general secretion pathway protein D